MALLITASAAGLGLHDYRAQPQGGFLYTPRDACKAVPTHSFTLSFTATLLVGGSVLAVIALGALLVYLCRPRSAWGRRSRHIAASSLVALGLVSLASYLASPIARMLPMQRWPGCAVPGPVPQRAASFGVEDDRARSDSAGPVDGAASRTSRPIPGVRRVRVASVAPSVRFVVRHPR